MKIDNEKGFSLIEITVALMILVLGITFLARAQRGVSDRIIEAREISQLSMLLDAKFQEIHSMNESLPFLKLDKEKSGDFTDWGSEYSGYKWKAEVKEIEFPDFLGLIQQKEDEENKKNNTNEDAKTSTEQAVQKVLAQMLQDHLKETVRELSVTVESPNGKKLSTSTYLVRFDKKVEISGLSIPGVQ